LGEAIFGLPEQAGQPVQIVFVAAAQTVPR
jgi:hypothetical protein